MAIVVTGASGQLGALVVRHLLARGVHGRDVVAAGRDGTRLAAHGGGVGLARIDYDDPATLDDAFGAGDTVLFVSGSAPGARIAQHANVVAAAARAGVARLVYTSIVRADSLDTVLTPDHRATEQLIVDSGIPFTILRNNLYAEVQVPNVVEAAARNQFVTAWGSGRIAGASRADYAEGAAIVLTEPTHDGQVYEFTADTAWGGEELALAASELLGKPITFATRTSDETEIELTLAGVPEARRAFAIAFDTDVRNGAFGEVVGTLAGLLGRPTTPLVDALRAALPRDLPDAPDTTASSGHGATT